LQTGDEVGEFLGWIVFVNEQRAGGGVAAESKEMVYPRA